MVVVKCSVEHCPFQTEDVTEELAIALLSNHGLAHLAPPAAEPVRIGPVPIIPVCRARPRGQPLESEPKCNLRFLTRFTRCHAFSRHNPGRHMCVTYRAFPVTPGTRRAISCLLGQGARKGRNMCLPCQVRVWKKRRLHR